MLSNLKRTGKVLIVSVMAMVMVAPVAFAITRSDPFDTPSIKGHKYTFTSEVWDRYPTKGTTTVEAVGDFSTVNAPTPAGYMGGQARLYNSNNGALVHSSTWKYNDSDAWNMWVYSPRTTTNGYYYAQNKGQFYNIDGYVEYTGNKSPILQLSGNQSLNSKNLTEASEIMEKLSLKKEYDVNNNGETYGSALSEKTIGMEPDLISAIGTNGVNGYIKSEDLSPKVSSIEEALELSGGNGEVKIIPLYAVDGTNVIGEFKLVTNYELVENQ
ncbi:peptidase [Paenibacillus sp. FSL R5-0914]|uniref:peptidase n=1 Tax=Paenibacillus sp. FSL R5-0914 TaxID=2921665 RepID=UPI0030FD0ABE